MPESSNYMPRPTPRRDWERFAPWHHPRLFAAAIVTLLTVGLVIAASTPAQPENDVTASLILLSRTQNIGSEGFTCPSSSVESTGWDFSGGSRSALNWS